MLRRLKVLDVCCGAGGASVGYARAGFECVGVDVAPQPNYPFGFVRADAVDYLLSVPANRYDLIHASPPCQKYTSLAKQRGVEDIHPDLIGPVREGLKRLKCPYVIENVPGSPLINPTLFCGTMFGLESQGRQLLRHRLFEISFPVARLPSCWHTPDPIGVYGNPGGSSRRDGIRFATIRGWREAMEIDWMTPKELKEAIPPAYTHWIGCEFIERFYPRGTCHGLQGSGA